MGLYSLRPVKSTRFQRFLKWCGLIGSASAFYYWHWHHYTPGEFETRNIVRAIIEGDTTFIPDRFDLIPKPIPKPESEPDFRATLLEMKRGY